MDTLLILFGFTLFAVHYLVSIIAAFQTSFNWGLVSFFPPANVLFSLSHFRRLPLLALGFIVSLLIIFAGIGLRWLSHPEDIHKLLNLNWQSSHASMKNTQTLGQLLGRSFSPNDVTLQGNILTLIQGDPRSAHQTLKIYLPYYPISGIQVDVLPTDKQYVPIVEVSWRTASSNSVQAKRFENGYTLQLSLQRTNPEQATGNIHLALTDPAHSVLSGKLTVNQLELAEYQSNELLPSLQLKALHHYLTQLYPAAAINILSIKSVTKNTGSQKVVVSTLVNQQTVEHALTLSQTSDQQWTVKTDRDKKPKKVAPVPIEPQNHSIELADIVLSPELFIQLPLTVSTYNGKKFTGIFTQVVENQYIQLDYFLTSAGTGTASYLINLGDIKQVQPTNIK